MRFMTQAFACFGMGYFLCEGAALNLPQGTMSLDPSRISLRYSTQPVVNAALNIFPKGNNRDAVVSARQALLIKGYFLCEGAALNLPQGTMSLDPSRISLPIQYETRRKRRDASKRSA